MTNTSITETLFAHVEFRPMYDFGDHCIISSLEDAEYFGVYSAPAGEPVCRDDVCASDALDHVFESPRYEAVRKWYNGNEIMFEFATRNELYAHLSEYFEDIDDEYDGHLKLHEMLGLAERAGKAQASESVSVHKSTFAERRACLAAALEALEADLSTRPSVFDRLYEIEKLESLAQAEPYKWHSEEFYGELHHCMDTASHFVRVELREGRLTACCEAHGDASSRAYIRDCKTIEDAKAALLEAIGL